MKFYYPANASQSKPSKKFEQVSQLQLENKDGLQLAGSMMFIQICFL